MAEQSGRPSGFRFRFRFSANPSPPPPPRPTASTQRPLFRPPPQPTDTVQSPRQPQRPPPVFPSSTQPQSSPPLLSQLSQQEMKPQISQPVVPVAAQPMPALSQTLSKDSLQAESQNPNKLTYDVAAASDIPIQRSKSEIWEATEDEKQKTDSETKAEAAEDEHQKTDSETKAEAAEDEQQRTDSETKAEAAEDEKQKTDSERKAEAAEDEKHKKDSETKAEAAEDEKQKKDSETKAEAAEDEKQKTDSETKAEAAEDERPKTESETRPEATEDDKPKAESETRAQGAENEKQKAKADSQSELSEDEKLKTKVEIKTEATEDEKPRTELLQTKMEATEHGSNIETQTKLEATEDEKPINETTAIPEEIEKVHRDGEKRPDKILEKSTSSFAQSGSAIQPPTEVMTMVTNQTVIEEKDLTSSNFEGEPPTETIISPDPNKKITSSAQGDFTTVTSEQPSNVVPLAAAIEAASMGAVDIRRGNNLNIEGKAKVLGSRTHSMNGIKSLPAFINSNKQSINNSIIFNISYSEKNPGVHLVFYGNPIDQSIQ